MSLLTSYFLKNIQKIILLAMSIFIDNPKDYLED